MPQISVIVPVYNVAPYLPQCLDSVLAQTFQDIEIICVDSISTDESPQILQAYAQKDPRVKVFELTDIRGLGRGRNRGLDEACGKYVFFLDSDDFLAPDALEKLYQVAEREKADLVSCSNYVYDDVTHRAKKPESALRLGYKTRLESPKNTAADFADFAFSAPFACFRLFRRDIIENLHLRFLDGAVEDVPFSVIYLLNCQKAVCLQEEYLYYYRVGRGGNISANGEKMLLDGIKNFAWLENRLRAAGVFEAVKETYWFNKMVLLIGDERLFAGRLGNVPPEAVQKAYDLIREDLAQLDANLFARRNALFRWKVRQLKKAVAQNDLKFPRRLRKMRNVAMIFLDPWYKLKSRLNK